MRSREPEPNLYESYEEERSPQEIIDFRFNQSYKSRLIEYATGLRPDDPRMGNRLVEDAKAVEAKYDLPPKAGPLTEIEHNLREIARKNQVDIRNKSACGRFFQENITSGVYLTEPNAAGVDIDKSGEKEYWNDLLALRHELIHALQHIRYPGMPIEVMEYEAYISELNVELLRQHPEDIEDILGYYIFDSVAFWYKNRNKKRGQGEPKIKPVWDNPEFFLRHVDKISGEEIEKYKQTDDYKDYKKIREAEEKRGELYSQEDYDAAEAVRLNEIINRLTVRREKRRLNKEEKVD